MKKIDSIIVHCSDSEFGCAAIIRQWHLARGWKDIGYHNVIGNGKPVKDFYIPMFDGAIEVGRPIDGNPYMTDEEMGAHAMGFNTNSIGICLIGVKDFSINQKESLYSLVAFYIKHFKIEIKNVLGHYEIPQAHGKTCPNIDIGLFRQGLEIILA